MPNVISLDGSIRQDNWVVVPRPAEGESLDIPADQPALIPADLWLAGYEHLPDGRRLACGSTATTSRRFWTVG